MARRVDVSVTRRIDAVLHRVRGRLGDDRVRGLGDEACEAACGQVATDVLREAAPRRRDLLVTRDAKRHGDNWVDVARRRVGHGRPPALVRRNLRIRVRGHASCDAIPQRASSRPGFQAVRASRRVRARHVLAINAPRSREVRALEAPPRRTRDCHGSRRAQTPREESPRRPASRGAAAARESRGSGQSRRTARTSRARASKEPRFGLGARGARGRPSEERAHGGCRRCSAEDPRRSTARSSATDDEGARDRNPYVAHATSPRLRRSMRP